VEKTELKKRLKKSFEELNKGKNFDPKIHKYVFLYLTYNEKEISLDEVGYIHQQIYSFIDFSSCSLEIKENTELKNEVKIQLLITSLNINSVKTSLKELFSSLKKR